MIKKTTAISLFAFLLATTPSFAQDGYAVYGSGNGYASNGGYVSNAGTNFETRLVSIEDQLRSLTGKTEQLEYAVRRLDQALQRMQSDYDARITKLETAPPPVVQPQQPVPLPPTATNTKTTAVPDPVIEEPNGRLGGLKVQGDKITGAVKDPKAPALPTKPDDYGLTSGELYERALGLLRQANYEEAEKAFKSFIDKNPQDKQIENARYWYGETYYVRAKFGDAAVAFAEAFQQNPKGIKAPDALLKLGMSLGSLGKTDDACATYASLKKNFPTAPVTLRSRADQERIRLKCK